MTCSHVTQPKHPRTHFGQVICSRVLVSSLLFLCTATACSGGGDLKPEFIPGTERIEPAGNAPWFTISPTERTIAFMEIDSTRNLGVGWYFHLATIDLTTGAKTRHDLRDIPTGMLESGRDPWQAVQADFEVAGWIGEDLYVQIRWNPPRSPSIVFTPGVASATPREPIAPLRCSDCPSPAEWEQVRVAFGLPAYDGTTWGHVAYQNGRFSNVMYRKARGYDGAAIERVEQKKAPMLLFERRERFKEMYIGDLRVSPDGHYLAYTLSTSLKAPFPTPIFSDRVYVRDVQTGRERPVPGNFRASGNLIWSADSKRLYYAVVDGTPSDGRGDGVYRLDLN